MDDSKWWSPDAFRFTPSQTIWLLGWLPYLRSTGWEWPAKEGREGMTFIVTKSGKTYFDGSAVSSAGIVRGWLDNMLCSMGRDGVILKLHFSLKEKPETIGRYFNLPRKVVKKIIEIRLKEIHERYKQAKKRFNLT